MKQSNFELIESNIHLDKNNLFRLSLPALKYLNCGEKDLIEENVIANFILLRKFSGQCVLCKNILDKQSEEAGDYICPLCISTLEHTSLKALVNHPKRSKFPNNFTIPFYARVTESNIYIPNFILTLASLDDTPLFNLYLMKNCLIISSATERIFYL